MKANHPLILLMIPLLGASPLAAAQERDWLDWKSPNGKPVAARFIGLADGKVTLALKNGKRHTVPLASLDADSQEQARREQERKAGPAAAPLFVRIPGGRFKMGSPLKEDDRITFGQEELQFTQPAAGTAAPVDVEPERDVDISRTLWFKRTEVTWAEWKVVLAYGPVHGYTDIGTGRNGYQGDATGSHPVTGITWLDAVKWCNLLSQIEHKKPAYHQTKDFEGVAVYKTGTRIPIMNWDADGYRLPTEAEWESACRAGRSGSKPFYADLGEIAWYAENSGGNTHPVGTCGGKPHRYGLQDIHGNVAEWCWDWFGLLQPGEFKDPQGPEKGTLRVFRGGSWADPARCCRAAYRGVFSPSPPASCFVGLRPVCGSIPPQELPAPLPPPP
jgi:formylglycine-generating enzyme required for sulfatase activity